MPQTPDALKEFAGRIVRQLLAGLAEELKGRREEIVQLALEAFDRYVEPLDLPGPDGVIDPALRGTVARVMPVLCDALIERLEAYADAA